MPDTACRTLLVHFLQATTALIEGAVAPSPNWRLNQAVISACCRRPRALLLVVTLFFLSYKLLENDCCCF